MRRAAIGWLLIAALCFGIGIFGCSAARSTVEPAGVCEVEGHDTALDEIELSMLREINAYRQSKGLAVLEQSPALRRAAMWKSVHRANTTETFDTPDAHDDPDRRWWERFDGCGYDFFAPKGENLARFEAELPADAEPAAVLDAWKGSPTHEAVQTDPRFRAIGLARVRLAGSLKTFWTADFGGVTDDRGVRPAQMQGVRLPGPDADPCIPASAESVCGADRLALWEGLPEAWQLSLSQEGEPASAEAITFYTLQYRAEAGSTASRAILTRLGWRP